MRTENPYQPPTADATMPEGAEAGLYSPRAIQACSFFFTTLAGGLMAARNFRRLGEPARARRALVTGLLLLFALVAVAVAIPDELDRATRPIFIGVNVGMALYFANMHKAAFAAHVARGGKTASPWMVVAVGACVYVAFFLLLVFGSTAALPD